MRYNQVLLRLSPFLPPSFLPSLPSLVPSSHSNCPRVATTRLFHPSSPPPSPKARLGEGVEAAVAGHVHLRLFFASLSLLPLFSLF
ncbi:hypothetical protein E2C01_009636 [Portunus trituberculatus]|uniref:Uncharacterized protein n=1 Tax=Portunus trituberculatus TaxID=210409 RepID=A0A5B7D698_PORTR|nr:hypothetical protein [Portunus trituberculatus]